MKFGFKKLCLVFGVLLFSLSFVGCGESAQEKGVNAIDAYMQEIRDLDLEYSLVFIEREAEQGKQAIMQAEDKTEIRKIKEDTLNAMKALVLTDEEVLSLKRLYLNGKEPSTLKIKAYLGIHDNCKVAIMRYDLMQIEDLRIGAYEFWFTVGVIRVYTADKAYHLQEAYKQGLVSDETLAILYENENYIAKFEHFYD